MIESSLPPFRLNDGTTLPATGFGTFGMTGEPGIALIQSALFCGYRLLDTAVGYRNEGEVGEAVHRSGLGDDVVITTKIPGRGLGYDAARRSIAGSRKRLGVDQIGLHLIHWPMPGLGLYVETWEALVAAQADGEIRTIGVSNFTLRYLTPIIEATGVVPAVNQIELHPHFPQHHQRADNQRLGICTQAWSPLGRGQSLFDADAVLEPARRRGVTSAQIVLRWHHQLGVLPIPRSRQPDRQRDNLADCGIELTDREMTAITALGRDGGRLWNGDPDTTGFM
jgi:2,5-diketo-D-gluconate reductase A